MVSGPQTPDNEGGLFLISIRTWMSRAASFFFEAHDVKACGATAPICTDEGGAVSRVWG